MGTGGNSHHSHGGIRYNFRPGLCYLHASHWLHSKRKPRWQLWTFSRKPAERCVPRVIAGMCEDSWTVPPSRRLYSPRPPWLRILLSSTVPRLEPQSLPTCSWGPKLVSLSNQVALRLGADRLKYSRAFSMCKIFAKAWHSRLLPQYGIPHINLHYIK